MKEIIKKRMNRYSQFISIFNAFVIFTLCCATFFSSISDAGFRSLADREIQIIVIISICSLLKEVIGAILEFKQEREKQHEKRSK